MEKRSVSDFVSSTMEKVREMIDANTIIGKPIETQDGITIIPVSRVTMGFAGGGSDFQSKNSKDNKPDPFGAGTGVGVKVDPVAFLIIKDGTVRSMNIVPPANTSFDRLIELIPDAVDKLEAIINKQKNKDVDAE